MSLFIWVCSVFNWLIHRSEIISINNIHTHIFYCVIYVPLKRLQVHASRSSQFSVAFVLRLCLTALLQSRIRYQFSSSIFIVLFSMLESFTHLQVMFEMEPHFEFYFSWDMVYLCNPGWSGTHYIGQDGPILTEFTCLFLQRAGVKGVHQQCFAGLHFLGQIFNSF